MKRFEDLSKNHAHEKFDRGVPPLNLFPRQHTKRQQDRGISRSFVPMDDGEPEQILGFFTLVAAQLDASLLSPEQAKRLPNRVPCILLSRLAVDRKRQGKGLGKILIAEAVIRKLRISGEIGVAGLFVEAKGEAA